MPLPLNGRAAESPCGRAHARHPRTTFSPLLPPPYFGSPLQSVHALSSPFFSLLPTLEAHCKVSTHYLLPSSPSSLLKPPPPEFRRMSWRVGVFGQCDHPQAVEPCEEFVRIIVGLPWFRRCQSPFHCAHCQWQDCGDDSGAVCRFFPESFAEFLPFVPEA